MSVVVPWLVGLGGLVAVLAVIWIVVPFLIGYFGERAWSPFGWAARLMEWAAYQGERLARRRNKSDS